MKRIAVIDYGVSNLDSVVRAVDKLGAQPVVTSRPEEVLDSDAVILPGVGAFKQGMAGLGTLGMVDALREFALEMGRPLLGICLGMQLLASVGTEGGECPGLGLIEGRVIRFTASREWRIPHVGWNDMHFKDPWPLFEGLGQGKDFYFVHSYHFAPEDAAHIYATTDYCCEFVSAVRKENIFGTQFHPEKSQKNGLKILQNFIEL